MLVLSRKMNESIIVNHDIKVVVLGIQGNKVRLEIEAPAEATIQREELQRLSNSRVSTGETIVV